MKNLIYDDSDQILFKLSNLPQIRPVTGLTENMTSSLHSLMFDITLKNYESKYTLLKKGVLFWYKEHSYDFQIESSFQKPVEFR